jgi:hypothetical protein
MKIAVLALNLQNVRTKKHRDPVGRRHFMQHIFQEARTASSTFIGSFTA